MLAGNYNKALNRFCIGMSVLTGGLLTAGALVTSNDAGLSIPDWPLAYGSMVPPFVGGIRYEFTHRVIAGIVATLTVVLAAWLYKVESRAWVRTFGYLALVHGNRAGGFGRHDGTFPPALGSFHGACVRRADFLLFVDLPFAIYEPVVAGRYAGNFRYGLATSARSRRLDGLRHILSVGFGRCIPTRRLRHRPASGWRGGRHRNGFLDGRIAPQSLPILEAI